MCCNENLANRHLLLFPHCRLGDATRRVRVQRAVRETGIGGGGGKDQAAADRHCALCAICRLYPLRLACTFSPPSHRQEHDTHRILYTARTQNMATTRRLLCASPSTMFLLTMALALAAMIPSGAHAIAPWTNTDKIYLWAAGPSEWVRDDVRYTYPALRAADGISKSQATQFMIMDISAHTVMLPSIAFNLKAVGMAHQYCAPSDGVGAWQNGTVLCIYDTRPNAWMSIVPVVNPDYVLNVGDAVYLKNTLTGKYCTAPSWPTNQAGIVCNSATAGPQQVFHVEA